MANIYAPTTFTPFVPVSAVTALHSDMPGTANIVDFGVAPEQIETAINHPVKA